MAKLVEMDENVKFSEQVKEETGPIVFINKFTVSRDEVDEFLDAWKADADV
jgi:hypothetical protein